jgi:type I restriction enzyme M protein
MPFKRDVLAHLSRDELLAVADRFELAVSDRRAKAGLIDAIIGSRRASLHAMIAWTGDLRGSAPGAPPS